MLFAYNSPLNTTKHRNIVWKMSNQKCIMQIFRKFQRCQRKSFNILTLSLRVAQYNADTDFDMLYAHHYIIAKPRKHLFKIFLTFAPGCLENSVGDVGRGLMCHKQIWHQFCLLLYFQHRNSSSFPQISKCAKSVSQIVLSCIFYMEIFKISMQKIHQRHYQRHVSLFHRSEWCIWQRG